MLVARGVCEELDQLKQQYQGLPDLLTLMVEDELRRLPRMLRYGLSCQLWTMMYMPQVTTQPVLLLGNFLPRATPSSSGPHLMSLWLLSWLRLSRKPM